jgi:lipid A 4'-phosphatase
MERLSRTDEPGQRIRNGWLPGLAVLLLIGAITTAVFQFTDLDLCIQRLLYRPGSPTPWPFGERFPWQQLYRYGTMPAVLLAACALAVMIRGLFRKGSRLHRLWALFLLLSLLAGPVLLVNGLFKTHWGRPRPREIVEFGGEQRFVPAMVKGHWLQGRSFACGHATMGFYLGAFYLLLRKKRPRTAIAILGGSIAYGSLIGVARMTQGAHFASDVIWAAIFTYGSMSLIYHLVMRVPDREARFSDEPVSHGPAWRAVAATAAISALGVFALLIATPLNRTAVYRAPRPAVSLAANVAISTSGGQFELMITDLPDELLVAEGSARGFGLPWSRIRTDLKVENEPSGRLYRFDVAPQGIFSELDMKMRLSVGSGIGHVEASISTGGAVLSHKGGPIPSIHIVVKDGKLRLDRKLRARARIHRIPDGGVECTIPPAPDDGAALE